MFNFAAASWQWACREGQAAWRRYSTAAVRRAKMSKRYGRRAGPT